MSFMTTRDALRSVRGFHDELSRKYARLAGEANRPRVRLLLEYMSGQETQQAEGLARYERTAAGRVLDIWFSFAPDTKTGELLARIHILPDSSAQEVVKAALATDACLRDWYGEMARMAPSRDVRVLFESLVDLKDRQGQRAVWSALLSGRLRR